MSELTTCASAHQSEKIHDAVREKYSAIARGAETEGGYCASQSCGEPDPVTSNLYASDQTQGLPSEVVNASLGCGNPTMLAEIHAGEIVLDLGAGAGLDVLLSARRVGDRGKAYGLDMTDDMLDLARRNASEAGVENVEFLKGQMERIPLPDGSVDVIISNCVLNLAPDKDLVLREAYRVLKPGGRFAVADVVAQGQMPENLRRDMESWVGCVAGALGDHEYVAKLHAAGFTGADIQITRVYPADEVPGAGCCGATSTADSGALASAFIRARKPS